jgi:5-methylcytosine-specific restriction enzyme A
VRIALCVLAMKRARQEATMPKKPCMRPGCPKLVERGQQGYCDEHKGSRASVRNEAQRGTAAERGYDWRWAQYSKARLRREPLCIGLRLRPGGPVVINTHPELIVGATLTDHIVPHKGDKTLFWDPNNHQSGCDACHNVKTATEDGGFGRAASVRG